ncbi:hypothetical protein ERO13_A10G127011v2 [Gossypium hirsutum]|uniref:Serine/threonine-protein kinase BLUS1 n=3 Tax=Gossypium TaxID=3633 RepID=A0A1U8IER2_GOSHI|nr:serine/threonine-protein kinase BLUS1-like [Gossypium hirsutum]KAB2062193.1 hypothetical protein ES319_A10G137300v1 [Gossypium barbadense]KAG4179796.1 hypothetical protein ERO13_A10G127011v2 [Gossypium hirsutum]TYG98872.1 hypothetical protein ES288_A10G151600v1 [Gossypium darwinii]
MAYEQEDHPKLQFPLDSNSYNITAEIGAGVCSKVYTAQCLPINSTVVALKSIDLDQSNADFRNLVGRETNTSSLLSHPNILNPHCSFTAGNRLWVVMPFMSGGSLESIISSSSPNGIQEQCIAIILKETLTALSYLHSQGHLHRDIKASNILLDGNGRVKLADFGVSSSFYASSSVYRLGSSTFSSQYWMAPEVIHSHKDYSFKADIWSFGITALVSTKKFSETFQDMVASCLDKDPANRPSAGELLKHPFFESCNGISEFLAENLLLGLPSVEERFRAASKILEEGVGCYPNGDWVSGLFLHHLMPSIIEGNGNEDEEFEVHDPVLPVESTQAVIPCDDDGEEQQPAAGGRRNEGNAETMVNELMALMTSLDDQKEKVNKIINQLGAETINREDELEKENARLRLELEREREPNLKLIQVIKEEDQLLHQNERLRLENEKLRLELEKLQMHISATSSTTTDDNN